MKILNCKVCNKEVKISPSRENTFETCSHKCSSILKKAKDNCTCTNCNKSFHLKESAIKRYNRTLGIFCSQQCSTEYKKKHYKGKNNPNYRNREYDSDGYKIIHYPTLGSIKEHHYVVFSILNINKIPKGYCVHHRDCNIHNNLPENLAVLSISDHKWLHHQFGNAVLWAFRNNKISLESLIEWSNEKEKAKQLLTINLLNQLNGI